MTSWQIYWITRCDAVADLVFGLSVMAFLLAVFCGFMWGHFVHERKVKAPWYFKLGAIQGPIIITLMILLGCLTPKSKEMAAIIVIPKMVNAVQSNEKLTQMPDKVLDLANAWIEELKPKEK